MMPDTTDLLLDPIRLASLALLLPLLLRSAYLRYREHRARRVILARLRRLAR